MLKVKPSFKMAPSCSCVTVFIIVSMFSLVVCKPFLGDLLARAIASSSTPDDPQSHITDFRMMSKMDLKADKLKYVEAKPSSPSNKTTVSMSERLGDNEPTTDPSTPVSSIMSLPASSLWKSWSRAHILARIVDDIVKPAQERITLVFQTLVARTQPKEQSDRLWDTEKLLPNSTDDSDSDELGSGLEFLQSEGDPALIDPAINGSTLLSQFQARRNVLRRRVAKALSSITGLLILAANSRRESKPRARRSAMESSTDGAALLGDRPDFLDLTNEIDTYDDDDPKVTEGAMESEAKPYDSGNGADKVTPRRNFETVGIFILEVFGSIAGFSWGIFKQVQSLFS